MNAEGLANLAALADSVTSAQYADSVGSTAIRCQRRMADEIIGAFRKTEVAPTVDLLWALMLGANLQAQMNGQEINGWLAVALGQATADLLSGAVE